MRLYEGSIKEFNNDVLLNQVADKIRDEYKRYYRKNATASEYNSWRQSLIHLNNTFTYAKLNDNRIVIEYELPLASGRIDALLFGNNKEGTDSIVLIELKQWSNDGVRESENEGNVFTHFQHGWTELPHPSLQVEGYHSYLHEFMSIFQEKKDVILHSCAYCHNYSKNQNPQVLCAEKYEKYSKKYPVFYKEDVKILGDYLKEKLDKSDGLQVFNRFIRSPIRPSKKLLDHTSEMINKQQIFNLIDDQIVAYNAIKQKVKDIVKSKQKSVLIIKGGPGTGKSVIALEVMAELLRKGIPVFHTTGSSAFTNTLRNILGPRINGLPVRKFFNFFYNYTKNDTDSIDVLICDEAHRIRKDSNDWGVPYQFKSKQPQVDDLIRPAKVSIFFLDEYQIVRPQEIGNVQLIKESAKKFGIEEKNIAEYELSTQFRCSGSSVYLQWVDKILDLVDSDVNVFDTQMEFKIVDSPQELKQIIDIKNAASLKKDKARIVAGFCWPWNEPNPDGTLVNDVRIGEFEMPWENKKQFWKFATQPEGAEQVGTVYTSQGFEFDYIGIIWGPDLVYNNKLKDWVSNPDKSFDNTTKRKNTQFALHLKHVYRVLLTRAHRGVYIYFMDKDTENYFKTQLKDICDIKSTNEKVTDSIQVLDNVKDKLKYTEFLPVYSFKAAAGYFGEGREERPEGWLKITSGRKLNKLMFVCKVTGYSMEPAITGGSYCLFKANVTGTRQGKILLVQHRSISDPENGGSYTVKEYKSTKKYAKDGSWEHEIIQLIPKNKEFKPITIPPEEAEEFQVIGELMEVLK